MMLRTVAAAIAVAACTLSTAAAHAAEVRSGCGFDTVAQANVTGDEDAFDGVAYGYAVFDDADQHTLRCYVRVDGAEQASTPAASGTRLVVAGGPVAYTAGYDAIVDLCTEVDGVTVRCEDPGNSLWFVDPVLDRVREYYDSLPIWDQDPGALACPVLAALSPGIPGVIDIAPDGDTAVSAVGLLWDCPPYGTFAP
jgi:hypothetical protein